MYESARRSMAVVVFACGLLACSRDSGVTLDTAGGAVDTASEASNAVGSDADDPATAAAISALRTLADRDEALLEMARIAVTRRERLEVSADARRMLTEHRRESNRVLGLLKGEFRVTHQPTVTEREQQLVDTLNASGVGEFDRIFLDVAARLEEEDVRLIDTALPRIRHPAVRDLLTSIRQQRASEAASFRKRREALPQGTAA